MVGAICKWDILAHPVVTIRCFGWKVFFRALVANHRQTFLSLLIEADVFEVPQDEVPELVGRCVDLELRAKRMYETLSQRFADPESVGQFFDTLARQEQDHAELLGLCRAAACRGGWDEKHFAPWRDALPHLERQMDEAEAWMNSLGTLADALRLVIQVESSEINQVYLAVVAASESEFVRKLNAFLEAGREHIAYVCQRIPEFEPEFDEVCQALYRAYTRGIPEG
jgi:rubrerythrin